MEETTVDVDDSIESGASAEHSMSVISDNSRSTGGDVGHGKCVVCGVERADHLSSLGRGINTFVEQCITIGRLRVVDYIQGNPNVVHSVHKKCRLDVFNDASRVQREATTVNKKIAGCKRTRSSTVAFDFKTLCFYCSQPLSESKREDWHSVETFEMTDTIMKAVLTRQDDSWALEVKGRLAYATDLVAMEAKYHFECHRNFTEGRQHTPHKVQRGRPLKNIAQKAFSAVCEELVLIGENEFFTLRDVYDRMVDLAHTQYGAQEDDVYSMNHLRNKLKDHFRDTIYFSSRAGRNDIVGFSGLCDFILRHKYILEHGEENCSEAEKIVRKAAALILAELRETEYDRLYFPTAEDITEDGLRYVPPLLQVFVKRMIVNPLKQMSFGQGIVQAVKPNSCIMPIPFGLGVQTDRLGHRALQDEMSRFGFCMSNAEIRRFKFSLMSTSNELQTVNKPSDTCL